MASLSANLILIIFTCLVSWQAMDNPSLQFKLAHYPYEVKRKKEYYRWVTSGLIHQGIGHLLFNMLSLYFFGDIVETRFMMQFGELGGRIAYIVFYFSAIIAADLIVYQKHKDNPSYLSLGASGAVAAIMFSSIIFYPYLPIYLMFIPIPIYGILFGILYLFFEWYSGQRGGTNINHDAHFWGAIYGILVTIILIPNALSSFIAQLLNQYPN